LGNYNSKVVGHISKEQNLIQMSTKHYNERLEFRIGQISDNDISKEDKTLLVENLKLVAAKRYCKKTSFAVRLVAFNVIKASKFFVNVCGRSYLSINDFLGKDSTGNEVWAIIRGGKIVTVMFRKDIQPTEKMRVDRVIKELK
jgi:hypothetical protein